MTISAKAVRSSAFLFAALLFASAEAQTPTVTQCTTEYSQSSASDTCAHETITVVNGQCSIAATCLKSQATASWPLSNDTSITVDLDDVDQLSNCDGVLINGSC